MSEVRCPVCHEPTDSIKQYKLVRTLLFLFLFATWNTLVATACPRCMRKVILKRTAINILPANVLWVIVVLPFHLVQLLRTLTRGHSAGYQPPVYTPPT